MYTLKYKYIGIFFLLISCASRLNAPPSASNKNKLSQQLSSDYYKAKNLNKSLDLLKDCSYFKDKNYSSFPLQDIMHIYLNVYCNYKLKKPLSKWAIPIYQKIFITHSNNKQNYDNTFLETSLSYVDLLQTQNSKEKFLNNLLKKLLVSKTLEDRYKSNWQEKIKEKLIAISPRLQRIKKVDNSDKDNVTKVKDTKITLQNKSRNKSTMAFNLARDYERNRKFVQARRIYKKIYKNKRYDIITRSKSWKRSIFSFKNQRKKSRYLLAMSQYRRWINNQIIKKDKKNIYFLQRERQSWAIKYARLLWNKSKSLKAINFLKYTLAKYQYSNRNKAFVYWLIAQINIEKKKWNESLKYLKSAQKLETKYNDFKLQQKIVWSYGYTLILTSKYDLVPQIFEPAILKFEEKEPQPRMKFWLAYAYNKLNNPRANQIWNSLSKEFKFNFYGIISNIFLKKNFTPLKLERPTFPKNDLIFSWLFYLKEENYLKTYVKINLKNILNNTSKQKRNKLIFSYMYYAKEFSKNIFHYYSLSQEERKKYTNFSTSILFPTPFVDKITSIAKKFRVEPAIIFAITRQESAFNPLARSHADAFGLMQLIPSRARELSKKLNLNYSSHDDLFNPSYNITLGSYLIKRTLKNYNYNFIKTVASYNAGPSVIARWFKTRFSGDYFKFIELIPYSETRKYIKLTFRNYIIYKRLLSHSEFKISPLVFQNFNKHISYITKNKEIKDIATSLEKLKSKTKTIKMLLSKDSTDQELQDLNQSIILQNL